MRRGLAALPARHGHLHIHTDLQPAVARSGSTPAHLIGGIGVAEEKHMSEQHLQAAVVTTSGRWPTSGFEAVNDHQKVRQILEEATRQLQLAGTQDWIATVGAKVLNPDDSFLANGFTTGNVVIDFGPRQGGGGRRA
jgi:hypothetical protein